MRHWHNRFNTLDDMEPKNRRYTWGNIAVAGISLVSSGASSNWWGLGGNGGDNGEGQPATPVFQPDPYVAKTQDFAFPYYTDMLKGKIDPYYSAIGESGSAEFEKMLGLTTRDITNSTNENLVRRGMSRSGVGADIVSRNVGDASTKLRYEDFNRALTGKLNLLQIGSSGLSGVRSAALTNQDQMNNYGFKSADYDLSKYGLTQQQDAADAAMWGQILGSGVSAAAGLYGMGMYTDAIKAGTAQNSIIGGSGIGAIDYTKLIGAMGNQGNAFTNHN